jgi:ABC-type lipoprotein release transport system permease subunit
VDEHFNQVTSIDSVMLDGKFLLKQGDVALAVMGAGIAQRLNVNPENPFEALSIYMPNRDQKGPLDKAFNVQTAFPSGRFSIKQDYDYQYVFVSLDFIQALLEEPGYVSGLKSN